jgi:hypothetical protein
VEVDSVAKDMRPERALVTQLGQRPQEWSLDISVWRGHPPHAKRGKVPGKHPPPTNHITLTLALDVKPYPIGASFVEKIRWTSAKHGFSRAVRAVTFVAASEDSKVQSICS